MFDHGDLHEARADVETDRCLLATEETHGEIVR
jgi:hypothetical protein